MTRYKGRDVSRWSANVNDPEIQSFTIMEFSVSSASNEKHFFPPSKHSVPNQLPSSIEYGNQHLKGELLLWSQRRKCRGRTGSHCEPRCCLRDSRGRYISGCFISALWHILVEKGAKHSTPRDSTQDSSRWATMFGSAPDCFCQELCQKQKRNRSY